MGKLKFNYLELATKQRFLEHLLDGEAWEAIPSEWAPGPVKALEKRVQDAKDQLKAVKERQLHVKEQLETICERLTAKLNSMARKRSETIDLVKAIRKLQFELREATKLLPQSVEEGCWSAEELKERLAQALIAKEKRQAALNVQRQAVSDLHRLLHHQSDQLDRLRHLESERRAEADRLNARLQGQSPAVEQLCRWYRGMHELGESVTGVHCEVVRPDYLHVTVTNPSTAQSVPVHLNVDRHTGKLLSATVPSGFGDLCVDWKYVEHPQGTMARSHRPGHCQQRYILPDQTSALSPRTIPVVGAD